MEDTLILQFDGGSRGNPGPAGIGVVVSASDGQPLVTLGRFIGRATNNVAEYKGLITAMEEALKLGARQVIIRGDSELIIKQMRGEYRVNHPDMKVLHRQAQELLHQFDSAKIEHNLRHKNELADKLANLAMDRKTDVLDVDVSPSPPSRLQRDAAIDTPAAPAPKKGDLHACPQCGGSIQVIRPTTVRPHQLKPFVCVCGMKMQLMGDDAIRRK